MDVGQIGQVVRNLVLNAREAMSDGGTVSIRAGNAVLSDGNPHGLRAGRYVVLRHGGAITVESELGRGTSFLVLLPACEETPRAAQAGVVATPPPRGTARVLVMDDEPMVLRAFSVLLHKLGYDAVLVDDGCAAVAAYEQARSAGQSFDVVLLDLTVRGRMGGKEAMRELLARDPHARAIVMSGYSDDDVMREYARFGFCGRLTKPFDTEAVREVLARVVASGGPRRSSPPRTPRTALR